MRNGLGTLELPEAVVIPSAVEGSALHRRSFNDGTRISNCDHAERAGSLLIAAPASVFSVLSVRTPQIPRLAALARDDSGSLRSLTALPGIPRVTWTMVQWFAPARRGILRVYRAPRALRARARRH